MFILTGPQASHENVVQELRERLDESKEEIREIQSEVEHRRSETGVLDNEHLLIHSKQTAGVLPSEEVSTVGHNAHNVQ